MISFEEWSAIHKLHQDGWAIRKVARHLKVSRNTVRKALKRKTYEKRFRRKRKNTVLSEFSSQFAELAKQQNYNAQRMFRELHTHGYTGSYQQVRRAVSPLRWKAMNRQLLNRDLNPGQEGYVYWGTTLVRIGETKIRINMFLMMLGFSGYFTGTFLIDESIKGFVQCHEEAFASIGGIPAQLFYGNLTEVASRRDDKGRIIQFHPLFNESIHRWGIEVGIFTDFLEYRKERVGSIVRQIKKEFLSGKRFLSLNQLNTKFHKWRNDFICLQVSEMRSHTLTNRFRKEQPHLKPYEIGNSKKVLHSVSFLEQGKNGPVLTSVPSKSFPHSSVV